MILHELIKKVEEAIDDTSSRLEDKKNNINSDYVLAKLDFTYIDNMCDSISVYKHIKELLDDLQQRIINRNTK